MGDEGDRLIGARRKRLFNSRRAEEQKTQWVMKMTDKCRGHLERKCTD